MADAPALGGPQGIQLRVQVPLQNGDAVSCVQRYGSALNHNPHLHVLLLDGVWVAGADGPPTFVAAARLRWLDLQTLAFPLKTPWDDGTTHVIVSPRELLERLPALVPPPHLHLSRYHGVLAPRWRPRPDRAVACR